MTKKIFKADKPFQKQFISSLIFSVFLAGAIILSFVPLRNKVLTLMETDPVAGVSLFY